MPPLRLRELGKRTHIYIVCGYLGLRLDLSGGYMRVRFGFLFNQYQFNILDIKVICSF